MLRGKLEDKGQKLKLEYLIPQWQCVSFKGSGQINHYQFLYVKESANAEPQHTRGRGDIQSLLE